MSASSEQEQAGAVQCPFCDASVMTTATFCAGCGAQMDHTTGRAYHPGQRRWAVYVPLDVALGVAGARIAGELVADMWRSHRRDKKTEADRRAYELEAAGRLGVPLRHPSVHARWTFVHNDLVGVWVCRRHANRQCWRCGPWWLFVTGRSLGSVPTKLADLGRIEAEVDAVAASQRR